MKSNSKHIINKEINQRKETISSEGLLAGMQPQTIQSYMMPKETKSDDGAVCNPIYVSNVIFAECVSVIQ